MRVCLGIVCLNEARWLRLHLPVLLQATRIEGIVAIDGGSTDDSQDVIREFGGIVQHRRWNWHFAEQQNAVIELAETFEYDAMLKVDPDELWFPGHIDQAVTLLEQGTKAVVFPRINFEDDRLHYAPFQNGRDLLDYQTRLHVLHEGFRWRGQLHASVNAWDLWSERRDNRVSGPREIIRLSHAPIFHYEGVKPMSQRALKWMNYERARNRQSPLAALPGGYSVPARPVQYTMEYVGDQPLNPDDVGLYAPFSWAEVG